MCDVRWGLRGRSVCKRDDGGERERRGVEADVSVTVVVVAVQRGGGDGENFTCREHTCAHEKAERRLRLAPSRGQGRT